jgi:hypothetical protein
MDGALLSPDGRMFVTYGTSITKENASWVHLWDLETGKLLWQHAALELPLIASFRPARICAVIAFSPDSRTIALGTQGGSLRIHQTEAMGVGRELKLPPNSSTRVVFLPDGKHLLTWGNKTMRIWDVTTGEMTRSFSVPVVNCLTVTPDGRFVLVGGDGEFRGL